MKKCFKVTLEECIQVSKQSIQLCLTQLDSTFPSVFQNQQEATKHSKVLGKYVDNAYSKKLESKMQKCDL